MLSKLIIKLYTVLLEVGLWLVLLAGVAIGWKLGGWFGSLIGFVSGAVFGAIFFGSFMVLNDMHAKIVAIEKK